MKKSMMIMMVTAMLCCASITSQAAVTPVAVLPIEQVNDGWMLEDKGWYYYKDNAEQTGWIFDNNRWYYMDASGLMQTGWQLIDGVQYYLYPSGEMASGESLIDGRAYTFADSGAYQYEGIHREGLEDDVITSAWEFYHNNYDAYVHVWKELNDDRAERGLSQLVLHDEMSIAATYRAFHMHKHKYTAHFVNGIDLANEAFLGYTGTFVDISENIGRLQNYQNKLQGDIYQLGIRKQNDLLNSPSHAMNILRAPYTRVGIGIAYLDDGHYFNLVQFFTDRVDFQKYWNQMQQGLRVGFATFLIIK